MANCVNMKSHWIIRSGVEGILGQSMQRKSAIEVGFI